MNIKQLKVFQKINCSFKKLNTTPILWPASELFDRMIGFNNRENEAGFLKMKADHMRMVT